MVQNLKPLPHHLQDFLDWLDVEKGLSSQTQENYARYLTRFFGWLRDQNLVSLGPHELTPDHVIKYRLFLSRQAALKRSTQNCYLIALRSLLGYFMERDITSLSPEKIKLARDKSDTEVRFLTREQLEQFFEGTDTNTFRGVRDREILEVLFSTGLRIAELVSLDLKQIRFPKCLSDEFELVVVGKGGRVRTVYFSERALVWLKKYLEMRDDMEEALFITYRSEAKRTGVARIVARTIQDMFKKNAVRAGVSLDITPHVMRHSFATDLVSQDVDIRTIQEFLGHKNIAATQIYAHVTSKRLRDVHKKFHGGNLKKAQ
jgi:integrase/recombinase XerD